ncbi:MAG: thymidine kinase [Patescibacteria group bacterium]
MDLTLILGPMKSGKSFDLISYFAPLKYTDIPHGLFQSARNLRDEHICSRNGVVIEAKKVQSLAEILDSDLKVVGIDELHMFQPEDAGVIDKLLRKGVKVVASGLDTDYRGKMFDIIRAFLELGPREVKYKRAVCEICKQPIATYSQVLNKGVPITEGMPSVLPDDGTFTYVPVCRNCFVQT